MAAGVSMSRLRCGDRLAVTEVSAPFSIVPTVIFFTGHILVSLNNCCQFFSGFEAGIPRNHHPLGRMWILLTGGGGELGLHDVLYPGMMQKVAASQPTVLRSSAFFTLPAPIILGLC